MVTHLLDLENPVFRAYLTHGSVLVLKMMLMSILTGIVRKKHGVPASAEDLSYLKGKATKKSHEDVDRVRKAHRNDMENIYIYFLASFAYLLTDPTPSIAITLFRLVTVARCAHTYVYAVHVIPQPARGIAWAVAYFITGYMAVSSICHFAAF